MVCKEDICAWYKKVPGSTRIDVICALMQLSHPLERRYLGSVLESLCQIDYRCFLTEENKANDPEEVRKVTPDLHDASNRSRLSVYLSLLHSSNFVCSQLIYELLSSARTFVEKKNVQEGFSKVVVEDILLLLTLAINHPAFTFQQRSDLFSFLQVIKKETKTSAEHSPGVSLFCFLICRAYLYMCLIMLCSVFRLVKLVFGENHWLPKCHIR